MSDTLSQIAAGRMDVRVEFQRPVYASDAAGARTEPTYETQFSAWAEVAPQTGREVIAARRFEGEITHTVRCRARRDRAVAADWRLLIRPRRPGDADRCLEVDHLLDSFEQGAVWVLRCVERPAAPSSPTLTEPPL